MVRIEFRVTGATEDDTRQWRGLNHSLGPRIKLAMAGAAAAILIYTFSSPRTAVIGDTPVVARNIIAMVDTSGSMKGRETERDAQLLALERSGMVVGRHAIGGAGVSSVGAGTNLLKQLLPVLQARTEVDALYVFSDFTVIDDQDTNDEAGLQRLRGELKKRGLKLYLSTVNQKPAKELIEIAVESGGGVIRR